MFFQLNSNVMSDQLSKIKRYSILSEFNAKSVQSLQMQSPMGKMRAQLVIITSFLLVFDVSTWFWPISFSCKKSVFLQCCNGTM